ncbi:hypothetical protein OHU25_51370 [Streptomyces sp. NBC_00117]|uniref:hypothetical protein n=1 Tax=Streptomyces sp. NBC_00117 TaxID=2975657 RepID=UPI00324BD76E
MGHARKRWIRGGGAGGAAEGVTDSDGEGVGSLAVEEGAVLGTGRRGEDEEFGCRGVLFTQVVENVFDQAGQQLLFILGMELVHRRTRPRP